MSSGVTTLIEEYQPAPFGKPEARVLEMAVLALMALPALVSRRTDRYHLVHMLVWLHLALTSIRNAPLFAFAAAPALASLLDGLPITFRSFWTRPEVPVDLDSRDGRRPALHWPSAGFRWADSSPASGPSLRSPR